MSNPILCGVDASPASGRAAAVAARLSHRLSRDALLVHVEPPPGPPASVGLSSIAHARELGRMRALVDEHDFRDGAHVRIATGKPAEALLDLAQAHEGELVVVGSHGRSRLTAAVLGSVSNSLMRAAPCPVVVVPPDAPMPFARLPLGPLMCGIGGSNRDGAVLRLAADLAGRLGVRVQAVHAFGPASVHPGVAAAAPPVEPQLRAAAQASVEQVLEESGIDADCTLLPLAPAHGLLRIAEELRAELIVTGASDRGKLRSMVLGSVNTQLAAKAKCPMVVLPPGAELRAAFYGSINPRLIA